MRTLWIVGLVALVSIPFAIADEREEEHKRARRSDAAKERMDPEEILEGLEHGIRALEALGREREIEILMLRKVAQGVRERMHEGRRGRPERHDPEREFVHHQLRALQMAFELYENSEGEKMGRLAEMVEHAIHARELRLEGRRDREAIEVYESAPKHGNVIELLMYAAKLLKKRDKPEAAEFVGGVAKRMQAQLKERRNGEKERRGELERRVDRLERTVGQLVRIVEKLIDELEDEDEDDR